MLYYKSKEKEAKIVPNKNDLVKVYADLLKTAKGHNKVAYEFAITLLENLDNSTQLEIRPTKNGAYNIGDLGECLVKNAIEKQEYLTWARQGRKDIDRKNLNEVKTFASANRNPNGLKNPQGFIAVSKFGVHHITKTMVEKYWEILKENKGLKEISQKVLQEIIENENPKILKTLNEKVVG
jgi:hypothetical protein